MSLLLAIIAQVSWLDPEPAPGLMDAYSDNSASALAGRLEKSKRDWQLCLNRYLPVFESQLQTASDISDAILLKCRSWEGLFRVRSNQTLSADNPKDQELAAFEAATRQRLLFRNDLLISILTKRRTR